MAESPRLQHDPREELEERLRRLESRFDAVREIGVALGSTFDLDQLLSLILDKITRVMEADRSTLYLLDEERRELWSRVIQGDRMREIRLSVGEGIAGWVARTGEVVNVRHAYEDARFDPEWDRQSGYATRTILCAPMKNHEGRTTGVIQVLNKKLGSFTADDESLLAALASHAAISIENSRLFVSQVAKNVELMEIKERLEQKIRELDALVELERAVSAAHGLEDMIGVAIAKANAICGADAGAILLVDDGSWRFTFRASVGEHANQVQTITVPAYDGIAGWVVREGRPLVSNNVARDPRFSRRTAELLGYWPHSALCVPLAGEDRRILGAFQLLNRSGGRSGFTQEDLKLLGLIAGHVEAAIQIWRSRDAKSKEERLAVVGQLLSSVLHDLKTPMAIIGGYTQILADTEDATQRRNFANLVLRQIDNIKNMTGELLAFAKGRTQVLIRKVYVQKLMDDVAEELRRELDGKGVALEMNVKFRGVARLDEVKMRRVFHNLARNAVEAMRGGGRLSIEVDHQADDVVFRFRDTGHGIPPEIQGRLFESFVSTGKENGTGLGLAIAKKIVDEHHGTIGYESVAGEGTTFIITIPAGGNGG